MKNVLKFKRFFLKNEGFTLVGVVLVILVLSILGMSITMLTLNSAKFTSAERNNQSAFYIAEGALTVEMQEIKDDIETSPVGRNVVEYINSEYIGEKNCTLVNKANNCVEFTDVFGQKPKYIIEVKELKELRESNKRFYTITSTGIIGDEERVVTRGFTLTLPTGLPNYALFAKENITLKGNQSVKGNVATVNGTVTGGNIDGTIIQGVSDEKFPVLPVVEDVSYELEDIIIDKKETRVFDTNEELHVNDLVVNGHLKVSGKGKLTIYVHGELTLGNNGKNGGTINKGGSASQLDIYLERSENQYNSKTISIKNKHNQIIASLYAEDADFSFNGGKYIGILFTGGTISMQGNPEIKGIVIANNVNGSGGGGNLNIEYKKIDLVDGPLSRQVFGSNINPIIDVSPLREKK